MCHRTSWDSRRWTNMLKFYLNKIKNKSDLVTRNIRIITIYQYYSKYNFFKTSKQSKFRLWWWREPYNPVKWKKTYRKQVTRINFVVISKFVIFRTSKAFSNWIWYSRNRIDKTLKHNFRDHTSSRPIFPL